MNSTARGVASLIRLPCRRLASNSSRAAGRKASRPPTSPSPSPHTSSSSSAKQTPRLSSEYKPSPRTRASPKTPPPPRQEANTVLDLWKASWLPLSGAAILAGFLGFYIVGTATATLKSPPCCASGGAAADGDQQHAAPTGRPPALTGDNAEQFDKELNLPEWWMGITSLRRRLASRATGNVLELAMGTGRNLEYYQWEALSEAAAAAAADATEKNKEDKSAKGGAGGGSSAPTTAAAAVGIASFTGLDISADMLDVARRKLVKTVPPMKGSAPVVRASTMPGHTGGQLSFLDDRLRLVNSDAHQPLPAPSPKAITDTTTTMKPTTTKTAAAGNSAAKYDTIVQTFGLCSVSDPVAVLANLATVVKPETGRIILLEHGKGWSGLVNGLLDRNAGRHFDKYGCWWNRDIQALVEEAASRTPGLEVVTVERPNITQMGTLVWVELKVAET